MLRQLWYYITILFIYIYFTLVSCKWQWWGKKKSLELCLKSEFVTVCIHTHVYRLLQVKTTSDHWLVTHTTFWVNHDFLLYLSRVTGTKYHPLKLKYQCCICCCNISPNLLFICITTKECWFVWFQETQDFGFAGVIWNFQWKSGDCCQHNNAVETVKPNHSCSPLQSK